MTLTIDEMRTLLIDRLSAKNFDEYMADNLTDEELHFVENADEAYINSLDEEEVRQEYAIHFNVGGLDG